MKYNCNCDENFICSEECQENIDYEMRLAQIEYRLYCIKDESGNLIDVRDLRRN